MRLIGLLFLIALLGCDPLPPPPPNPTSTSRDPFGDDEGEKGGEAQIKYGSSRALVVGVSDYSSGTLSGLEGPTFDAVEVASVLASRFGFDVTLLLDKPPPAGLPAGVKPVIQTITAAHLSAHLDALKTSVTPRDVLLFYFAGHGLPGCLVPADANLPSPTDRKTWRNTIAYPDLAKKLRAANAHHTLSVLDCCYSGTALADDKGLKPGIGTLSAPQLRIAERDNLARVFNRRAFQVITAGAGDEAVADMAVVSREYAKLAKDLEGHSPFTGVFLQGLRGLTGLPDGRILASDLGYYLAATLVGENEAFKAKQAPKFSTVAGEGDFLFLPVVKVLNPRLVAPLYIAGDEYARLRESAADAVAQLVSGAPAADRRELAGAAAPHLVRLLRDGAPGPRLSAARALAAIADGTIGEFRSAIAPLRKLLDAKSEPRDSRRFAAKALGSLAAFSEPATVASLKTYLDELEAEWLARLDSRPEPGEIRARRVGAPAGSTIADLDARRAVMDWLATDGVRLLDERDRRHERGRALVQRAERYLAENRVMEARFASGAAITDLLWPGSADWARADRILRTTPDVRQLWSAGGPIHHSRRIGLLRYSPGGLRLASADVTGEVAIWNLETGRLEGRHPGSDDICGVIWSPDGTRLYVVEPRRLRRITGAAEDPPWALGEGDFTAFAVRGDGGEIALGRREGRIQLVDTAAGAFRIIDGHAKPVVGLGYSGATLISADIDGTVRGAATTFRTDPIIAMAIDSPGGRILLQTDGHLEVRDLATTRAISKARIKNSVPDGVRPCADGSSAIVQNLRGVTRVEITSGTAAWTFLDRPQRRFGASDLSADGRRVAVAEDTEIRFLDAATGIPTGPAAPLECGSGASRFSPDGRIFTTFNDDGVQIWDAGRGTLLRTLAADGGRIKAVAHHPGGAVLAIAVERFAFVDNGRGSMTGVSKCRVRLVNVDDGKLQGESPDIAGPVLSMAFSAPGAHLIAGFGKCIGSLDPATAEVRYITEPLEDAITGVAFSPAGDLLGVTSEHGSMRLRRSVDGTGLWEKSTAGTLVGPSFDSTGMLLAGAGHDGSLRLWVVSTGEEYKTFEAFKGQITTTAWSPDGFRLAAGGVDRTLRIWDFEMGHETGRETLRIDLQSAVTSIGWSPDGACVLSSTNDGPVRLHHLGSPGRRLSLREYPYYITKGLAWTPDAAQILLGTTAGIVFADVRTGALHRQFQTEDGVLNIASSPDGAWIAASIATGYVEVWDAKEGKRRASIHVNANVDVAFHGGELLTVTGDRRIRRWDLDGKSLGDFEGGGHPFYDVNGPGEIARTWDGRRIARGAIGVIEIVEKESGAVRSLRLDPDEWAVSGAFTADGARFVAVMGDGKIFVLDGTDARFLRRIETPAPAAMTVAPAGHAIAVATPDGRITVWDLDVEADSPGRARLVGQDVRFPADPGGNLYATAPEPLGYIPPGCHIHALRKGALADELAVSCLSRANIDSAFRILSPRREEEAARPMIAALLQEIEIDMIRLLHLQQVNEAGWRLTQAGHFGVGAEKYHGVFNVFNAFTAGDLGRAAEGLEKWTGLPMSTQLALLIATRRRLGDAEGEARAVNGAATSRPPRATDFTWAVLDYYGGKLTGDELFKLAKAITVAGASAIGKYHFYVGLDLLAKKNPEQAKRHFQDCRTAMQTGVEAYLAGVELKRLDEKPPPGPPPK